MFYFFSLQKALGDSIKGKVWTGSMGKKWNAYRALMGYLTEIESLKELNADDNIVTKWMSEWDGVDYTLVVWNKSNGLSNVREIYLLAP